MGKEVSMSSGRPGSGGGGGGGGEGVGVGRESVSRKGKEH